MIQLAAQFAERPDVRYGLTAMCVGLGQGGSVIWENPHYNGKKERAADMTDYSTIDFSPLAALAGDDEVVTHSYVRDIRLASGKVLALITLDNGRDHTARTRSARPPCSSSKTARRADARGPPARSTPSASPASRTSSPPAPTCRRSARSAKDNARRWASSGTWCSASSASSACRRSRSSTGSRWAAASRSR